MQEQLTALVTYIKLLGKWKVTINNNIVMSTFFDGRAFANIFYNENKWNIHYSHKVYGTEFYKHDKLDDAIKQYIELIEFEK